MVVQWFQDEAQRCRTLHKARRLHDVSTRMSASLFFDRVLGNTPLPQLHITPPQATTHGKRKRDDSEEEERGAVLRFLIHDLPEELYTELQAGMWMGGTIKGPHTRDEAQARGHGAR
jgi:hypothetical protein